jgi:hypothetical protein
VDGKTVYELIRSKFVAMAGAKEWQRLLLLSGEGPMSAHTEYGAKLPPTSPSLYANLMTVTMKQFWSWMRKARQAGISRL